MQPLHEIMMDAVREERQRLASRRTFLSGGAKLAAGGALAMAATTTPAMGRLMAVAQEFESDLDVLNYALTLEHLETAFYRDLAPQYAPLGEDPFLNSIDEYVALIGEHEAQHVAVLTDTITQLGGEPVAEATYDFGVTDGATFLATAAAVENLGVQAYDGAGQFLENADLLTAAGSIVAVEARHAAYLNLVIGEVPWPGAFETPATPEEVLAAATPFFVTAEADAEADAEGDAAGVDVGDEVAATPDA